MHFHFSGGILRLGEDISLFSVFLVSLKEENKYRVLIAYFSSGVRDELS